MCERQDSPGLSAGLNPLKLVNAVPSHCSLLPHHRYQEGLIQRDFEWLSPGVPRAKTPLMLSKANPISLIVPPRTLGNIAAKWLCIRG